MEPVHKRPKLRVRKAAAEEQPVAPAVQTIPTGGYLWGRDEEELVDYEETEDPATLYPMEDDVSVVGDDISAPTDGQHNICSTNNDFPADIAEADHMVGAKRSQMFL
jgi:hypothetical protein